MAIIWQNNRWIDSETGLPADSPFRTRFDSGLTSERSNALAGYQGLSGMGLNLEKNTSTPYNMPEMEDRFSIYGLSGGMNQPGNVANFWEGEAKRLGYGKEKSGFGKYLTSDNIGLFADLAGGASDLASIWSGFQANKLLKQEMADNDANSRANFASNAMNYNDQAEMRNQWLIAQGRDPLYTPVPTTYS